jgi:hypothetical protein
MQKCTTDRLQDRTGNQGLTRASVTRNDVLAWSELTFGSTLHGITATGDYSCRGGKRKMGTERGPARAAGRAIKPAKRRRAYAPQGRNPLRISLPPRRKSSYRTRPSVTAKHSRLRDHSRIGLSRPVRLRHGHRQTTARFPHSLPSAWLGPAHVWRRPYVPTEHRPRPETCAARALRV